MADLATFTVTIRDDRTTGCHVHVYPQNAKPPYELIEAAIRTLEIERDNMGKCPVHRRETKEGA